MMGLMISQTMCLFCKPCDCTNLTANCTSLRLTEIPHNIPNNISHLIMRNNNLNHIKNFTFANFYKLRLLDLSLCNISTIDMDGFAKLWNIHTLDLCQNYNLGFKTLGQAMFGLQHTPLRTLKASSIVHPHAVCVCISKQMLKHFSQTNLEVIELNNDRIEIFEPGALLLLPSSLKTVFARNNRFEVGPYMLDVVTLINLEELDISGYLEKYPSLDIPWTEFDLIDKHCRSFHYYNLENDAPMQPIIKLIPLPPKLKVLKVRFQGLSYPIPPLILGKNSLAEVNLKGNVLSKWNGPVERVESITMLDLSNNYCHHINTDFFKHLRSLKKLDMSFNNLQWVLYSDKDGSIFRPLNNLTHLNLIKNNLIWLPSKIFTGLSSLQYLNLSRNIIRDMILDLKIMNDLHYIDFSNNSIGWLVSTFRKELEEAGERSGSLTIDLSNNPLACTCDNLQFLRWLLHPQYVQFNNKHQYVCDYSNGTRVYLNQLEQIFEDLSRFCGIHFTEMITASSSVILIVGFIIGPIAYKYRWKLRYLYYAARSSAKIRQLPGNDDHFEYDAFISYSEDARLFVVQTMKLRIEEEAGLKLCLHNRDFLPSLPIAEGIVTAVKTSRKTVLVMSPDFVKSYWCLYEMNMADMESQHTGRDVLLILLYKHIKYDQIPSTVMYQIKSHTYIEYPNTDDDSEEMDIFWDNFTRAIKL
ncbi:hypothetical protein SNE40_019720 [Patella caerulea]